MDVIKDMKEKGARLITISFYNKTVYYHFSLDKKIITHSVPVEKVESIFKLFPGAKLYEREINEKFGVKFKGFPSPKKLFT